MASAKQADTDPAVAYVISEVGVADEALADRYRSLAEASIAHYGGRYLARGALPEAVEGDWSTTRRLVIVEFPSMARAREWYASAEYREALTLSRIALSRRLLFVEGVKPPAG